jgi:hypothetical protein
VATVPSPPNVRLRGFRLGGVCAASDNEDGSDDKFEGAHFVSIDLDWSEYSCYIVSAVTQYNETKYRIFFTSIPDGKTAIRPIE